MQLQEILAKQSIIMTREENRVVGGKEGRWATNKPHQVPEETKPKKMQHPIVDC